MIDFLTGNSPLDGHGDGVDTVDEKILAAGSLAAGIGLFVLSMIVMLAIGLFAGALVLTERIAQQCLGEDCPPTPRALLPERTVSDMA